KLIGNTPKMLINEVYGKLQVIMQAASFRPSPGSALLWRKFQARLLGSKGEAVAAEASLDDQGPDVLRRLRIYAGDERIIWFDLNATRRVVGSTGWPENYNLTYGKDDIEVNSYFFSGVYPGVYIKPSEIPGLQLTKQADVGQMLSCAILYRFATKSEFE